MTQIYDGNILLRTLTEKSYIHFKERKFCIKEMISNNPKLLRWMYFNREKISFIEDILKKINISEEFYINKPGKSNRRWRVLEKMLINQGLAKSEPLNNRLWKKYTLKDWHRKRNYNSK